MNPDQPETDPKLQNTYNPLSAMRDDEVVLCEIKRHPIGIIGVYLSAVLVIGVVLAAMALLPGHVQNITAQDKTALLFGSLFIIVITLLYVYIAHIIYTGNRWILTDDSLTQVTQTGLFRKHSSQLSLANLEDITADQNGIIQDLFGYGDLKAETAGERSKFVFPLCPNPNEYARKILNARERFILENPEKAKRANDRLNVPPPPAGMPAIDPQQYQQFLQYQQMVAQQQAQQAAPAAASTPTGPAEQPQEADDSAGQSPQSPDSQQ